jgi:hypothetical protein
VEYLFLSFTDTTPRRDAAIAPPTLEIVGTEQGIQVRLTGPGGEEIEHMDQVSISYTELLRLSYDMEKGELRPPCGHGGSGLEVNNPVWKYPPE